MGRGIRLAVAIAAASSACLVAAPRVARAFCGFYVAGSDQQLVNDATQVVLMRNGTRTVLAMQNHYKGPPEAFAMVVPVPVVLREQDVKTLTKDVFEHVEQMGAPRLVEYWEQDPCSPRVVGEGATIRGMTAGQGQGRGVRATDSLGVKVEAQFVVGEYQIVILSAKDSTGLDTWLRREKYNIPKGAEPLLRPYVEGGMKFFVAKVDPKKVQFVDGRAELSPIRFHYDADELSLPIRLGLANSSGTQDLIVNILAADRYEVANYNNVTIPTNLDLKPDMKDKFGSFYAALFDRTVETHEGAIVTEYAWQATTCDPCPGPQLRPDELQTLGADVLLGMRELPLRYNNADLVLTRLHARYGKDIQNDLVFKQAPPIVGGREIPGPGGKLEEGAQPARYNNFQGRYAIRHPWTGPIRCSNPQRGIWGGPPLEIARQADFQPLGTKPALGLADAPRGAVKLASAVMHDIPEIDVNVDGYDASPPPAPPQVPVQAGWGSGTSGSGSPVAAKEKRRSGCGCQSTSPGDAASVGAVLGLGALARRRRRRR